MILFAQGLTAIMRYVFGIAAALFLDGPARVEEPAAMQVFSDEVGSAGRAFVREQPLCPNLFWQREA